MMSFAETLHHIMPALGILGLIALWILAMLCGMSYFSAKMPDAPSPTRWKPAVVRIGMVAFMALVGILVAQRNGVWPDYHLLVGLVGAVAGLLVDLLWRVFTFRMT